MQKYIRKHCNNCSFNSNGSKNGIGFFSFDARIFLLLLAPFITSALLADDFCTCKYSNIFINSAFQKKIFSFGICGFLNVSLHILAYLWLYYGWFVRYCTYIIPIFISFVGCFLIHCGFCFDCALDIEYITMIYTTRTLIKLLKREFEITCDSILAIDDDNVHHNNNNNNNAIKQSYYVGNFQGWKQWNWRSKCTKSPCKVRLNVCHWNGEIVCAMCNVQCHLSLQEIPLCKKMAK